MSEESSTKSAAGDLSNQEEALAYKTLELSNTDNEEILLPAGYKIVQIYTSYRLRRVCLNPDYPNKTTEMPVPVSFALIARKPLLSDYEQLRSELEGAQLNAKLAQAQLSVQRDEYLKRITELEKANSQIESIRSENADRLRLINRQHDTIAKLESIEEENIRLRERLEKLESIPIALSGEQIRPILVELGDGQEN